LEGGRGMRCNTVFRREIVVCKLVLNCRAYGGYCVKDSEGRCCKEGVKVNDNPLLKSRNVFSFVIVNKW
jgi:hypothetical protein